ncbi:response regulator transcription factor [Diplocloster modestus]|uniref:Stage 0 sporulation protein A homolog n=1 Tax=Diplocloster modestus TaxID=2850322 RepID=A0ABS6KDI4_9FIRM|nr:response regulator [Diplocloster modestus]MBU9728572.1 response regulator [Diplocloster modestus]
MIKVLLVEDEDLIRQGLKLTTTWSDFGSEIIGEAADGEEGREMILRLKPDLVITDIKMPKLSGLEMIESLQDEISCEYIILSGYDEFAYAKRAMRMGVRGYLLKPIDDKELEEVMSSTIKSIREKQAVYKSLSEKLGKEFTEEQKAVDFGNLQDKYLARACEIIHSRYQEDLTLRNVADELNISDSYLGKLFKTKTSYTFLEVLTLYRIKGAVDLLKNSDLKVYEIAYAIGYGDAKYFSKVFRKIVGIKPMEFKNGYQLTQNHILNRL